MNIRGIELMRRLGLPGPDKERVFSSIGELDLDELYEGATLGASVMAFDYREPIEQLSLHEKNEHEYKIARADLAATVGMLKEKMRSKGVSDRDLVFLAHQTYASATIAYSGKATVSEEDGLNFFGLDAVAAQRVANTDFRPSFSYVCPFFGGRAIRSEGRKNVSGMRFPEELLVRVTRDIRLIASHNPLLDFEVYKGEQDEPGRLFYHDLSFAPTLRI